MVAQRQRGSRAEGKDNGSSSSRAVKRRTALKTTSQQARGGRKGQFLNWLIDHLPFEVHLPGYRFCGPGTRLQTRLKSGQRGVNRLDELCRGHDIAYSLSSGGSERAVADERLRVGAKLLARDASVPLSERLAARLVASVMKIKLAV